MKIFVGQNLLVVPLCYDNEKSCKSLIGMKIFLGASFIASFFLVLLVKNVVQVS